MPKINRYTKSEHRFENFLVFIIFFLSFLGYYSLVLFWGEVISFESSRLFTIPIRIVILFSIILLYALNLGRLQTHMIKIAFWVFVTFFLLRLLLDTVYNNSYYISTSEVLFYFISFCVVPFSQLSSIPFKKYSFNVLFNSFFYGGVLFSIIVLFFYGQYIGQVSRLGQGVTQTEVINPLALSYSSALVIGVFSFYLLHNKLSKTKSIIAVLSIILSVIPFFLGASRGSLLALAMSILIYFYSDRNYKKILPRIALILIIIYGLVFLGNSLGSNLFERVVATYGGNSIGGSVGNERLVIWKSALNQFMDHPFIGDKLAVNGWENYAHNIFIETLQTTGVFGFIPLLILFIYLLSKAFFIAKHNREYYWVVVIFIQTFVQNFFSGAVYSSPWLWFSSALVLVLNNYLKQSKYEVIHYNHLTA